MWRLLLRMGIGGCTAVVTYYWAVAVMLPMHYNEGLVDQEMADLHGNVFLISMLIFMVTAVVMGVSSRLHNRFLGGMSVVVIPATVVACLVFASACAEGAGLSNSIGISLWTAFLPLTAAEAVAITVAAIVT